jgi:hypothetical protein
MIPRLLREECSTLLQEYPVVTIIGPRQAGKTTLARTFTDYAYGNLEHPETRQFAAGDPSAFLKQYPPPIILDEIQRAPELLSYIQVMVDEDQQNGRYILTGSHQLSLKASISQSLAGRTGILHLLPLSIAELDNAGIHYSSFEEYAVTGFLPRIHDQKQRPWQAYSNYYQTYVERDVRQLVNLKDAGLFEKFMKLLAGRVGQLVDYAGLAGDVGVDAKTVKNWLSILEASYLVFKLSPYFENFGKRVIKTPKYYFTEPGLLTYLLGIENAGQVSRDPLAGLIFENLAVIECLKARYNRGRPANLYFYRDSNKNEIDLIIDNGSTFDAIEIKSSSTYHESQLKSVRKLAGLTDRLANGYLLYNGEEKKFSNNFRALRFDAISRIFRD